MPSYILLTSDIYTPLSAQGAAVGCRSALILCCCCLSVPGYLGCFNNNNDEDVLPDKRWRYDNMTIAECLQFCRRSRTTGPVMRFAGVHSGSYCLCGVDSTEYDRHGRLEDWRCDQPCAGNEYEICGGYETISIYDCESCLD